LGAGVFGVKFCPECGTVLTPLKREDKIVLKCAKCGHETYKGERAYAKPKPAEKVIVIGKQAQKIRTLPTTRVECPKCGHGEAYYWIVQTRGADESSTQFFRCVKCQYTWREMS
jgi:DNA-directed RNA polymerase subunit M